MSLKTGSARLPDGRREKPGFSGKSFINDLILVILSDLVRKTLDESCTVNLAAVNELYI